MCRLTETSGTPDSLDISVCVTGWSTSLNDRIILSRYSFAFSIKAGLPEDLPEDVNNAYHLQFDNRHKAQPEYSQVLPRNNHFNFTRFIVFTFLF